MSKAKRVAIDGMLAAVYFALSFLVIDTGTFKFTFTSLAIIVAALLYGPADACAVALIGEFLYQVIIFGVTATMPVWLVPPVIHALFLGLAAKLLGRKVPLYERTVPCFAICLGAAVINSACNTAALYIDSKYWGYYEYHMVFGVALIRIAIGLATACVVTAVAIPLVKTLPAGDRRDPRGLILVSIDTGRPAQSGYCPSFFRSLSASAQKMDGRGEKH